MASTVISRSFVQDPRWRTTGVTGQSAEESIAVVRRFFEEVFSEGIVGLIEDLVDEDAAGYDSAQPEPDQGTEGIRQLVTMYRSAFPDISFDLHETRSDGGLGAVRWTSRGTHEGALMGIEPTGREVEVEGIEFDRVEDGKLVETWVVWDTLGVLQQIDAVPESPVQ